jgi:hypothetical protein
MRFVVHDGLPALASHAQRVRSLGTRGQVVQVLEPGYYIFAAFKREIASADMDPW